MSAVVSPDDKCFKFAMSNQQVAKDFFAHHLPDHIKAVVNLESLYLHHESYVSQQLKLSMSDLLYSADFLQGTGYLYLLVEHQSRPDKLMPFRIWEYMCNIAKQHLKQTQTEILPVIYPMVFYHGKESYPHSLDLFKLFAEGAEFMRDVLFNPFQLIDLNQIPDTHLQQHPWVGVLELLMKHIFKRDLLAYLQAIVEQMRKVETLGGSDYIIGLLEYALVAGNISNQQQFVNIIERGLSPIAKEHTMTLAEQLHKQGKEEGLLEGQYKGKLEGRLEVALNLLQQGMDEKFIAKVTELPLMEVKQLKVNSVSEN